jgi:hypothetical protein
MLQDAGHARFTLGEAALSVNTSDQLWPGSPGGAPADDEDRCMPSHFPTVLEELEATARIHDTLLRFCRGIDRKDWPLLLSAFHDDATDDHGWVTGNPRRDLVPGLQARHETVEHSAHVLSNIAYDFSSSTEAMVESYGTVVQREQPGPDGSVKRTQAMARYLDLFQRREGGDWLIADRTVVYGDMVVTSSTAAFDPPSTFAVQRRDGNDPLELREAERLPAR